MGAFLLYVLAVVVLGIPRTNVATVLNKVRSMVRAGKLPKSKKLVKMPSQVLTVGLECWSQGNEILFVMDEALHQLRVTQVQKGKRGKSSFRSGG